MSGMGLLGMSFCGGVMILVALLLRAALLRKLPKRIFPFLWMVVLLRLLLPFDLPSPFSAYSLLGRGLEALGRRLEPGEPADLSGREGHGSEGRYDIDGAASGKGGNKAQIEEGLGAEGFPGLSGRNSGGLGRAGRAVGTVWAAGVLCCGCFLACSYLGCLKRFKKAEPLEGEARRWLDGQRAGGRISVRRCGGISAPLTYGFFRPVILLPASGVLEDARRLEYVLQHEYVHIRRGDAMVKLVMAAALCIHWLNPLVWVMSGFLSRDVELACDEGVLMRLGENARSGYALTLIAMEEGKKRTLPLYSGFSRNAAEERIRSIMRYDKAVNRRIAAVFPLALAVAFFFSTSAGADGLETGENPEACAYWGAVWRELADLPGTAGESVVSEIERLAVTDGMPGDGGIYKVFLEVSKGGTESGAQAGAANEDADIWNVTVVNEADPISGRSTRTETGRGMSEDERAVRRIASAFWQAYLVGDRETMKVYLSEDYEGEIEIYPQPDEGRFAADALFHEVKGDLAGERQAGDRCEIWVEFRPMPDQDTVEYLNMEFVKGQRGWKVCFYGLEM